MTKPGNSGSEEPKQAEQAPEPEAADSAAETRSEDTTPEGTAAPETPATSPDSPSSAHETPSGAPGGPPNSTLPEGTDNSGAEAAPEESAEVTAAEAKDAEAEPAEAKPAEAKPAEAKDAEAKPAEAKSEGAEPAEAKDAEANDAEANDAEAESAEAKSEGAEAAEAEPAEAKSAEAKSAKVRRAKAAAARADEDAEPLMAELEKAPPPPREEALRAQTTRRLDELPPRTLKFSFYFFAASGLVWLVSAIIFLINKQVIIDAQVENNDRRDISADQIAGAVNQLLWFYLIIALVFAVFLSLFGWKATEGTRRARTLVTIFGAIMVIFHLLLFSTQFGILSALLALIGLALLWSRSARAYFPRRQPLS